MPEPTIKNPSPEDLWKTWKASSGPAANAQVLQQLDPVIHKAASAQVGDVNPLIKGHARRLALTALQSYDPSRGRLISHLYNHMQGLKRYAAQTSAGISVPERLLLDRRAMEQHSRELTNELGREPTDDELADATGLNRRRIQRIRAYHPAMSQGYFDAMGEQSDSEGGFTPAVRSDAKDTSAWEQIVYGDLSATDKKIFEWAKAGVSGLEMARRLRITPGAISQRAAKIQRLLDQQDELSPFGG